MLESKTIDPSLVRTNYGSRPYSDWAEQKQAHKEYKSRVESETDRTAMSRTEVAALSPHSKPKSTVVNYNVSLRNMTMPSAELIAEWQRILSERISQRDIKLTPTGSTAPTVKVIDESGRTTTKLAAEDIPSGRTIVSYDDEAEKGESKQCAKGRARRGRR